jgi:hypothetical protein
MGMEREGTPCPKSRFPRDEMAAAAVFQALTIDGGRLAA